MPTFGSLFSGIGGLDLGLERAGWDCRWQVEIDPFCRAVLARHWPSVTRYADVFELGGSMANADLRCLAPQGHLQAGRDAAGDGCQECRVDLICGGFPCQPVSHAGKRQGQSDARWLWPEFHRIIRLLRPHLVLVENVPGLLSANGGNAMGQVLGDLAASGYDAEWDCIPASAVGAPHRRDRVWIVAYATLGGMEEQRLPAEGRQVVADSPSGGKQSRSAQRNEWRLQAPILRGGWNITNDWAVEPDVGRVAHGIPARVDRLRGLGNAVVPQVAEWIGRRLMTAVLAAGKGDR